MELRKALEERFDELVGEFGVLLGMDMFDAEVRNLVSEILIERSEVYIWEEVQNQEKS